MYDFTFSIPTKVIFGRGAGLKLGEELARDGVRKALLLYGGGSVHKNGVYKNVTDSLRENGISFAECSGVKPNPVVSKAREAVEIIKSGSLEAVVAVGGGSVIDSAKAIAAGALYEGDTWDFFSREAKVERALPVYAVVTVSATASEMNYTSVMTNEEKGIKQGLHSPHFFPRLTLIDPTVQSAVPERQMVNGGIDAITHALETYFSASDGVEIQQEYIEGLVRSLMRLIPALKENPADYGARSQYAWATVCALNGTAFAGYPARGDFASHQLGHMLSAWLDAVHGETLSVMMPAWMKYVYKEDLKTFARFAEKVFGITSGGDEEKALAGIEALRGRFAAFGAPVTLRELGVSEDDLPEYAEAAAKAGPLGILKKIHSGDALEIYRLAY